MKKIIKLIFLFFVSIICIFYSFGCVAQNNGLISSEDNNKDSSISGEGNIEKGNEDILGAFYTLQDAYDKKLLTSNDIASIAEKHNNKILCEPTIEIANKLKMAYAKNFPHEKFDDSDVVIKEFLGAFSGCFAVIIAYDDEEAVEVFWKDCIADVAICYSNGFELFIYKEIEGKTEWQEDVDTYSKSEDVQTVNLYAKWIKDD